MNRKDLRDKRIGKLYVLDYDRDKRKWCCLCDCGKMTYVRTDYLTRNSYPTQDCGCVRIKQRKEQKKKRKWALRERKRKEREQSPTPEEIAERCREIQEERLKQIENGEDDPVLRYRHPKIYRIRVDRQ